DMSFKLDNNYRDWINELKTKVRSSQAKAALAVNTELIQLYWELGEMISKKLDESDWGDKVISNISNDLREEFPAMGGLSETNLKYCRLFFKFYSFEISQQAVDQLREVESVEIVQQAVGQLKNDVNQQIAIRQQAVAQIPWGH